MDPQDRVRNELLQRQAEAAERQAELLEAQVKLLGDIAVSLKEIAGCTSPSGGRGILNVSVDGTVETYSMPD